MFKKTLCLFFFLFLSSAAVAAEYTDAYEYFRRKSSDVDPHKSNQYGMSVLKIEFRLATLSGDFSRVMPYLLHPNIDLHMILDEDSGLQVIHVLAGIGAIIPSYPGLNAQLIRVRTANQLNALEIANAALGVFGEREDFLRFSLTHNIIHMIIQHLLNTTGMTEEQIKESILNTIKILLGIMSPPSDDTSMASPDIQSSDSEESIFQMNLTTTSGSISPTVANPSLVLGLIQQEFIANSQI